MFRNLDAEQVRHGYTNAVMAELLGVSRTVYERKKRTGQFNRPQVEAMLRLFGCRFEYLFFCESANREQSGAGAAASRN